MLFLGQLQAKTLKNEKESSFHDCPFQLFILLAAFFNEAK